MSDKQFFFDAINVPVMVKNDLSSRAPVEARSSNLDHWLPPIPTTTQPDAGPSTPTDNQVVSPWPVASVMTNSTSIGANDPGLPTPNALAHCDAANDAQTGSSPQTTQTRDHDQLPLNFEFDPAALLRASEALNFDANAAQIPNFDFGLPDSFNAPVENSAQGTATALSQTIAHAPEPLQHFNIQTSQLHAPQPLPPLFDPEFGNSGANNFIAQTSSSTINRSGYAALNISRSSSMGMAADGGFNAPSPAGPGTTAQRRSQRRRAPQFAQAPQQAQPLQKPQLDTQPLLFVPQMNRANTFIPQLSAPASTLQTPGAPALMIMNNHPATFAKDSQSMLMPTGNPAFGQYRSVLTPNGTSQLIAAQPNFQAPFFPGIAQMPNTVAPAPFSGTSTPVNPRRNDNTAVLMKRYAQKSFELEEQKQKHEILSAQLQQLMAREEEVQALLQSLSNMVQLEKAVPPPVAPQPGPSSLAVPPPPLPPQQLAVPTALEPTSVTANVEQAYHFDQPSDGLPTFPDFAQDFGTMPLPPYLAAPFEDQWQQPIGFDSLPRVVLDLSQQQNGAMFQGHPYPDDDGFDQLSNRGPEEHHPGTLQQQQVEQVLPYGNLPQETHKETNGSHLHRGSGATASSSTSSSSKRKRDEAEGQANTEEEAGGGPPPPKRKRTRRREIRDKGKEREVVTVAVDENTPSTSSKRKRDEAGDDAGASNEAGDSGSAQPVKKQKGSSQEDLGSEETAPKTIDEAFQFPPPGPILRMARW